jgi:hypothetical protein
LLRADLGSNKKPKNRRAVLTHSLSLSNGPAAPRLRPVTVRVLADARAATFMTWYIELIELSLRRPMMPLDQTPTTASGLGLVFQAVHAAHETEEKSPATCLALSISISLRQISSNGLSCTFGNFDLCL